MSDRSRNTLQRAAIRHAFQEAGRPLDAPEVLAAARARVPGLGIATVYRELRRLVKSGRLAPVDLPGTAMHYEPADKGHHHHFRCDDCGRVFELEGCAVELGHLHPPGFVVESHEVLLFGSCELCAGG